MDKDKLIKQSRLEKMLEKRKERQNEIKNDVLKTLQNNITTQTEKQPNK